MNKTKITEIWQVTDDSKRYQFNVILDYEKHQFSVIDLTNSIEQRTDGDISMIFLNGERLSMIIHIKQFIDEYFFKIGSVKTEDLARQLKGSEVVKKVNCKSRITTVQRSCSVCGETYQPTGNRQMKCTKCKSKE